MSDHCYVDLEFEFTDCKRGPGLWRLNTRLLESEEICQKVRDKLRVLERDYIHMGICERWEEMKLQIQKLFREEGRQKANICKDNLENLKYVANELLSECVQNTNSNMANESIKIIQDRIYEIEEEITKGCIF